MLTLVFFCQPLGQLAATIVTLIAAARQRDGFPPDATITNCTGVCLETMDSVWRWVIGVGVIPAFIALWFRLTIIESPRYTADVGRDSRKAMAELSHYQGQVAGSTPGSATVSTTAIDVSLRSRSPANGNLPGSTDIEMRKVKPQGEMPHLKLPLAAIKSSVTGNPSSPDGGIFEIQSNRDGGENQIKHTTDFQTPPAPSWEDFKDYIWHKGHLKTLIATSICWFCVDLPFYGLGMSSPHILSTIWYGKGPQPDQVYDVLIHNVWQSLVTVSIGSIIGCLVTFMAIDKLGRRTIQWIGFLCLFILYITIGASFTYLYETGQTSAVIVLYIFCQGAYNFGMYHSDFNSPAQANSSIKGQIRRHI
jgi:MFS transporter, PHS family, inorganic phosphate transporter